MKQLVSDPPLKYEQHLQFKWNYRGQMKTEKEVPHYNVVRRVELSCIALKGREIFLKRRWRDEYHYDLSAGSL